MALPDFSRMPIVVVKSTRPSLRRFYIVFCTLLGALALFAALGGDEEAIFAIPMLAGIAGIFELFGSWLDRSRGCRIEINTEWVRFSSHKQSWSEPLSSYTSVSWSESYEVKTLSSGGVYVEHPCYVQLLHGTNPRRSVELFSSGMFSNRERLLTAWRVAAQTLELPTSKKAGAGVEIVELPQTDVTATDDVEPTSPTALDQMPASSSPSPANADESALPPSIERRLEVQKARRGLHASIPIVLAVFGVIGIIQNVASDGPGILTEYAGIILLAVLVLAALLAGIFMSYRVLVTAEVITVVSYLGKFDLGEKKVNRRQLREIAIHSNKYGIASVALQSDGQPSVVIPTLSTFDAQRIKRLIEDATKG
jgi:hypothetical protein